MKKEFLFDKADLKIYHDYICAENKKNFLDSDEILFNTHMHPRGIKELIESRQIRLAKSILFLLHTLESDKIDDRLQALHSLRDEVLFCAKSTMTKNTARVLLAVMKDFVRETEKKRKIELLHDFNALISGNPLFVRKILRRYNLLEMPETWTQIAFDYHVHDSYTKGRKTPTHLVMDAWIKGIRKLTVIYYNLVPAEAVRELLTASAYMQISVNIGIEFTLQFKNKFVNLIWQPDNLPDAESYLKFLNEARVKKFAKLADAATEYKSEKIFGLMDSFNKNQLGQFNKYYNLSLSPLKKKDFTDFNGTAPVSTIHLSEFIYYSVKPLLKNMVKKLETEAAGNPAKNIQLHDYIDKIRDLSSEKIFETYLKPLEAAVFNNDSEALPDIMRYKPYDLISLLETLTPDYWITLNLTDLTAADILELLYDCKGKIHNLEIYNYKNYARNSMPEIPVVRKLEKYINEKDSAALKRLIKKVFLSAVPDVLASEDRKKILNILMNIDQLFDFYRIKQIHDRWGSDSTGYSKKLYGMGFVLFETLPRSAQSEVIKNKSLRLLPVHIKTAFRQTYQLPFSKHSFFRHLLCLPFRKKTSEWIIASHNSDDNEKLNNLVALGDRVNEKKDSFFYEPCAKSIKKLSYYWTYMPTNLKNGIKILLGFIPAFLTFYLTKDWWVLMYLGAPIWFAITGIRNIIQSVLGGDSIYRSRLLRWTYYIDWSRIADSLLYSGFSVPVLDYFAKTLLLNNCLSINMSTDPFLVYTIMSLVNGIYMSGHNILRGFPRMTVIGNFFRSIIAIPVAFFFSNAIGDILTAAGIIAVDSILQKWAAIISKAASDFVGGFIEGIGDRERNIRLRKQDYTRKFEQMQQTCYKLELAYPQKSLQKMLKQPKSLIHNLEEKDPNLLKTVVYDALDFFYFWMYQPHARTVLKIKLASMHRRTKYQFLLFQNILKNQRVISTLLVQGIVGMNFEKVLALYLNHSKYYLDAMNKIIEKENFHLFQTDKEKNTIHKVSVTDQTAISAMEIINKPTDNESVKD